MATYFVASGGSNTAPYDTWAKAATSLATALAAATATGDIIVIQYNAVPSGDAEVSADTTYTFAGNVSLISASNDGGSAWTPTVMGTANWIGNSTTNRSVTLSGAFKAYIYGVTLRTAGGVADSITVGGSGDGLHYELESCYLWQGNTVAGAAAISVGNGNGGSNSYVRLVNCTLRFGATGQSLRVNQKVEFEGGSVSSAGSAPTTLFTFGTISGETNVIGMDLSHVTGTLVGSSGSISMSARFIQCRFGSGVTVLATQTPANKSSAAAYVFDCASGDTHGLFGYYDAFGSVVSDTGIYFTSGAAAQSWKIVTTANCSYATPFLTPWIDSYNTGTSAVTPYIEILRDGSATAYQNDEVWTEFMAKVTSTSTQSTFYSDRKALEASAADQAAGAGLGSWTGEGGTAWSGKCDSGASLTPAENGHIRARIAVGEPSITVYADLQIRT